MLHNTTLERLLTFPDNNSHSSRACRTNFSQASKEITQPLKGVKRKLSPNFYDERRSKYRHQDDSLSLPLAQCDSKHMLDSSPAAAVVASGGLCLPPLPLNDTLNSAHWCYTKVSVLDYKC